MTKPLELDAIFLKRRFDGPRTGDQYPD